VSPQIQIVLACRAEAQRGRVLENFNAETPRTQRYPTVLKFIHWGSSFLESTLKENKNRGQLLYWFDYPDFDRERCAQLGVDADNDCREPKESNFARTGPLA